MTQNAINSGYPTADGEVLIGATGGRTLPATLTAGVGIGIANGANSITITNTGASGNTIQQVRTMVTSMIETSGSFGLNYSNDTIPQQTDGTEIMTLSITPTNVNSVLLIEAIVQCGGDGHPASLAVALFQDSTLNALATTLSTQNSGAGNSLGYSIPLRYFMTAGTTSSTTFKIRAALVTGGPGNTTVNGRFNGGTGLPQRIMGGTSMTMMTITEYAS